jgi:hypothetical protein
VAGIQLSIDTSGISKAQAWLAQIQGQMPYAASRALNDAAKKVTDDLNKSTSQYFDRPTRFTQNAYRVSSRSSKTNLVAEVRLPWLLWASSMMMAKERLRWSLPISSSTKGKVCTVLMMIFLFSSRNLVSCLVLEAAPVPTAPITADTCANFRIVSRICSSRIRRSVMTRTESKIGFPSFS